MRVDNRCDRVRRIVKSVDEFEAERDQQSNGEQEKWQYARDGGPRRRNIAVNVIRGKEEPESHDGEENQDCPDSHRLIEMRLRAFGLRGCDVFRGNGRHWNASIGVCYG